MLQPGQPLGSPGRGLGQLVTTGQAVLAVLRLIGGSCLLAAQRPGLGGGRGCGWRPRRRWPRSWAIQGDQPQADQAGGGAQLQRLDQEPGQGLFVADSEPGDSDVVGGAVAAQDAVGDVLVAAPFDLAGGADPGAVGVQQHGQQHPGLIRGPAVSVSSIRLEERAEVELVDHVEHEPGQVVGRQPVTQVGWEQEGLVAVTGTEVVGHGRSYAISLLCCRLQPPSQQPFPQQAHNRQWAGGYCILGCIPVELKRV